MFPSKRTKNLYQNKRENFATTHIGIDLTSWLEETQQLAVNFICLW